MKNKNIMKKEKNMSGITKRTDICGKDRQYIKGVLLFM